MSRRQEAVDECRTRVAGLENSSRQLREKREGILETARQVLEESSEGLSADAEQRFNAAHDDADGVKKQIDATERQLEAEREALAAAERAAETIPPIAGRQDSDGGDTDGERGEDLSAEECQARLREMRASWYRGAASREQISELRGLSGPSSDAEARELRAMGIASEAGGGIFIPRHALGPLTEARKKFGSMRRAVERSGGTPIVTNDIGEMPMPTSDTTNQKGKRLGEGRKASESDVTFGERVLRVYMYNSGIVLVPWKLLETPTYDIEGHLLREFGKRNERAFNEELVNYKGTNGPDGLIWKAVKGATAAAANKIEFTELIDLEHSVDADYREGGTCLYMTNDTTLRDLKKLKDADGRPIWQSNVALREPDTINGYQYEVNNDMPEMGGKARSVLFGDYSNVMLRDVEPPHVVRFQERYMDRGMVGFTLFSYHGGIYVNAGTNPIAYLQHP